MTATWRQVAVIVVLIGVSCCRAQSRAECDPKGPQSCFFVDHSLCNWTAHGNWSWYNASDTVSIRLYGMASLASRVSCATQGQLHCVTFLHNFAVNNATSLNVYVTNVENPGRSKVWSLSSSTALVQGSVPVTTDFDFFVEFEAISLPGYTSNPALIDSIQWTQAPCPLTPATAQVETPDSVSCHTDGPESCSLYGYNPCSWKSDSGWVWYQRSNDTQDTVLRLGSTIGVVTSRQACATQLRTDCLSFQYKFDEDDAVDLKVFVRSAANEDRKFNVWSLSSPENNTAWHNASVPIKYESAFVIEIEATTQREGENISGVYIANFEYVKNLPCSLQPSNATSTTSAPIVEGRNVNFEIIIISVVSAVLITIVIITVIVFLILYRRNKIHLCFKKEEPTGQSVAERESVSLASEHVACYLRENSRGPASNHYSTIHDEYTGTAGKNLTGDAYTEVNIPAQTGEYQTPGAVCHIPQGSNAKEPKKPGSQPPGEYKSLDFDREKKGIQEHTDGTAGRVYDHLQKGDGDAYSEVEREKKINVIGNDYSEVQHQ